MADPTQRSNGRTGRTSNLDDGTGLTMEPPATARLRFDERVVVVTGAGSGLGAAHARLLADRGASVVVNDLDGAAATHHADAIVASGGRAIAVPGDVSTESGADRLVRAAIADFGRIDIVINNAGVLRSGPFSEMTASGWDQIIAVNMRGTFLVTHAAWPHFLEQGYGRVVSTTSNSGLLGVARSSAYAAAKAGVYGMTRSLALEAPEGLQVNAVAPMAYTAMSATSAIAPESWRTGEGDPWSRRLDIERVTPIVAWLAHEKCSLNGQVLSAAGGRVARFVMRVTEGFVDDELTPERVADRESELLDERDIGVEYCRAADEGNDLYRRLMT